MTKEQVIQFWQGLTDFIQSTTEEINRASEHLGHQGGNGGIDFEAEQLVGEFSKMRMHAEALNKLMDQTFPNLIEHSTKE